LGGSNPRSGGLDADAAAFLDGETLAQLEESADALAQFLGARERTATAGYLGDVMVATARRKQELTSLFAGRPASQPRDESGRFASTTGGFDGGARPTPVPTAETPEQAHGRLLGELLRGSRSERGASF
jgi:hypothetical protein